MCDADERQRSAGEATMASAEATALWKAFRDAPVKQIDMPLAQRRDAGEHAEDPTAEPVGVTFGPADRVGGLWALPPSPRAGAAVLYLFGGGYVLGSPASRRKTAGHLALATNARVLVPSYRLAPEHTFPAAVDDAVAAYRWLLRQGAAAERAVIVGDSAGGGLAVATALALRDARDPRPAGVVAMSPWADLACTGRTMETQKDVDCEATRPGLLEMAGWYLAGKDPRTPLASPVYAHFDGMPPLLAVVGGNEILLDDAVRLVRATGQAGINASLHVGGGMQHVFPIWKGAFPEADAAIALIGDWITAQTN
jgi:acetyl esterase/lipase